MIDGNAGNKKKYAGFSWLWYGIRADRVSEAKQLASHNGPSQEISAGNNSDTSGYLLKHIKHPWKKSLLNESMSRV